MAPPWRWLRLGIIHYTQAPHTGAQAEGQRRCMPTPGRGGGEAGDWVTSHAGVLWPTVKGMMKGHVVCEDECAENWGTSLGPDRGPPSLPAKLTVQPPDSTSRPRRTAPPHAYPSPAGHPHGTTAAPPP